MLFVLEFVIYPQHLTAFGCQTVRHHGEWQILPRSFLLFSLARSLTSGVLQWQKPSRMGEANPNALLLSSYRKSRSPVTAAAAELYHHTCSGWLLRLCKARHFIPASGSRAVTSPSLAQPWRSMNARARHSQHVQQNAVKSTAYSSLGRKIGHHWSRYTTPFIAAYEKRGLKHPPDPLEQLLLKNNKKWQEISEQIPQLLALS